MRPKRDAKSVILEHPSSPSPVVPVKSRKSISATTDRHHVVEEIVPQHGVGKITLNDDEGNPITTYVCNFFGRLCRDLECKELITFL